VRYPDPATKIGHPGPAASPDSHHPTGFSLLFNVVLSPTERLRVAAKRIVRTAFDALTVLAGRLMRGELTRSLRSRPTDDGTQAVVTAQAATMLHTAWPRLRSPPTGRVAARGPPRLPVH
jgi:hypothetical protein